jgi:hypothetical protein
LDDRHPSAAIVLTFQEALMTNRVRIAVMVLSSAIVAVGASALRTPEAHAARICTNTACNYMAAGTCDYYGGHYCLLGRLKDSAGNVIYTCNEGEC